MNIDFFPSGPAVMIHEEQTILFLADIHMGIEYEMRNFGFHIRSRGQARIERICDLVQQADPDLVVILGDVKHRISGTSYQEFFELGTLFSSLRKHAPFLVTPGNHDPGIEAFLKPEELRAKEGTLVDSIGILHGHTIPDPRLQGHLVLCGHHHPVVSLPDQVGVALKSPCYILGELNSDIFQDEGDDEVSTRVLMVPSCNEMTGYGIEKTFRSPFSPISRSLIIETAEILLPDGTYAGDLLTHLAYDEHAPA